MSATVLLLKTQTRLLAWPFFVLLAGALAATFVPVDPFTGIACVAVILAMLFSGPVVFGAEYAEGARDYLDTRPVSQNRVFWSKILLVSLTVVVGCEILASTIQPEYLANFTGFVAFKWVRSRDFLLMAFFFCGTFWLSAATVFCRDLVRGLLYGIALLPFMGGGVVFASTWFFRAHLPYIVFMPGYSVVVEIDPQAWVFQVLFLLAAGPLALGLLRAVYLSRAKRRLRIGWILPLAIPLAVAAVALAHDCLKYDGSATWQNFGPESGMLAASIQENTLLYIPDDEGLAIKRLDLRDSNILKDPRWSGVSRLTRKKYWRSGIIRNDTAILFNGDYYDWKADRKTTCYHIENGSSLFLFKTYVEMSYALPISGVAMKMYLRDREYDAFYISLDTGEIVDATEAMRGSGDPNRLLIRDREYLYDPEAPTVHVAVPPKTVAGQSGSYPGYPVLSPAIDGYLLAGFSFDPVGGEFGLPSKQTPAIRNEIRLKDTSNLDNLLYGRPISVPPRLYTNFRETADWLDLFGLDPTRDQRSRKKPVVHLSMGGGYLCLWVNQIEIQFQRCALWDITNPDRPRFVGIFPGIGIDSQLEVFTLGPFRATGIQPPIESIERDDGALGFPVGDNQILWLEIPERMKEPRT